MDLQQRDPASPMAEARELASLRKRLESLTEARAAAKTARANAETRAAMALAEVEALKKALAEAWALRDQAEVEAASLRASLHRLLAATHRIQREATSAVAMDIPAEVLAFDENGYLAAYPDVQAAVQAGTIASGLDHYLQYGLSEGRRLPGSH